MSISLCLLMVLSSPATVADVQSRLHTTLVGGSATSADAQRALNRLLGWSHESRAGIVVGGKRVSVTDLDVGDVHREVGYEAPVEHFFEVFGEGPQTIRVHVPVKKDQGEMEVYRRAAPGLYVRIGDPLKPKAGYVSFATPAPGRFVARHVDVHSYPDFEKSFFDVTPPSEDPAAKVNWRLYRAEPALIAGPTPLVLIHGMGTDRWADFIHWAAHSPDAETFRRRYQVWNYPHPTEGVNAAIGYRRDFPGFGESIVAYLDRFILSAMSDGVETDGVRCFFPEGRYCILTHSEGGLVARAFLNNFPEQAERVLAVVTLSAPHLGSPWATPEWVRHTATRLGFSARKILGRTLEATVAQFLLTSYFSTSKQSDLDLGWVNYDAAGGLGLPCKDFQVFRCKRDLVTLTVSPRDANQTGARELPGCADNTFEPAAPLSPYCGGLDEITPATRGEMGLDKFFLYAAYIVPHEGSVQQTVRNLFGTQDPLQIAIETLGLNILQSLMGVVLTPGTDVPLGAYLMGDGLCPVQSQLMLDGRETDLVYKTATVFGWRIPALPFEPRMDVIREHTLADPARIRILRGWNHFETVSGRYNVLTGHSDLFGRIAEDLLSVPDAES
jgi:pimeloyl-ACP methyl ester carboxylesterase